MANKSVDPILSAVKSAGEAAMRLHEENKSLATENAALRKDAERYRWLRGESEFGGSDWAVMFDGVWIDGSLDAAIDAAIDNAIGDAMESNHAG